eukprot:UN31884
MNFFLVLWASGCRRYQVTFRGKRLLSLIFEFIFNFGYFSTFPSSVMFVILFWFRWGSLFFG